MRKLMTSVLALACGTLFAGLAWSADVPQPETPGSARPKAAAEAKPALGSRLGLLRTGGLRLLLIAGLQPVLLREVPPEEATRQRQ